MLDVHTRIGMCATIKHLSRLSLRTIVDHVERHFVDRSEERDVPMLKHNEDMRLLHCVEWGNAARSAWVEDDVNLMLQQLTWDVNWAMHQDACCPNCDCEIEDYPFIYAHRNKITNRVEFTMDDTR